MRSYIKCIGCNKDYVRESDETGLCEKCKEGILKYLDPDALGEESEACRTCQ